MGMKKHEKDTHFKWIPVPEQGSSWFVEDQASHTDMNMPNG